MKKNTPEEAREIVNAFYEDKPIEKTSLPLALLVMDDDATEVHFETVIDPCFNFQRYFYRIKPLEPREFWIVGLIAYDNIIDATTAGIKENSKPIRVKEVESCSL